MKESNETDDLHLCVHLALIIARNSAEECIIPKIQKKEMKILHSDNISAYLKAAEKRGVPPMFFLEFTSGVRMGELVALLWSDLDVDKKTLPITKQAVRAEGGEIKVTRPKTDHSMRKISIPQEAIDPLIQEHAKHPGNPSHPRPDICTAPTRW